MSKGRFLILWDVIFRRKAAGEIWSRSSLKWKVQFNGDLRTPSFSTPNHKQRSVWWRHNWGLLWHHKHDKCSVTIATSYTKPSYIEAEEFGNCQILLEGAKIINSCIVPHLICPPIYRSVSSAHQLLLCEWFRTEFVLLVHFGSVECQVAWGIRLPGLSKQPGLQPPQVALFSRTQSPAWNTTADKEEKFGWTSAFDGRINFSSWEVKGLCNVSMGRSVKMIFRNAVISVSDSASVSTTCSALQSFCVSTQLNFIRTNSN